MFADVFTIVAQFGDIPILLAGDFQSNPLHYPSISNSVNFHGWFDSLSQSDCNGDTHRPLTYSKDGSFSGSGDFCSSIDGIILNHVAHTALRNIEVLSMLGIQHRPIRATFSWASIRLHGFVHRKFAPLDTSCIGKPGLLQTHTANTQANTLWDPHYVHKYNDAQTQEAKWSIVNEFCVNTLLASGATWGLGERTRGQSPTFTPKQFCPGQSRSNTALSLKGSWLENVLGRLWELFTRLQRPASSLMDEHILTRTITKAWRTLATLHAPYIWHRSHIPNLADIHANIMWVQFQLQAWDFSKRQSRIKSWKQKVQESALSNKKYIFHHLKNKVADEPSNLVLDDQQNIVCQPNDAIQLINSKWDDIFSANVLHEEPLRILQAAWPYLSHDSSEFEIPPLGASDLACTIAGRNPDAAAGLDGWRTTDLQALPVKCLEVIANFFHTVEEDCGGDLPTALVCAKQAILNKAGPASPINRRLITILSPMLLAYTGTRFRQLQAWQAKVMHPSLYGGIKGRSMTSISNGLRLDIDSAQISNEHLIGIKLDQSKCFDRLVPSIAGAFMLALGVPKGIVNVFILIYRGLRKHLSYRGWISKQSVTNANGVAQGCSFSLLAINAYMHIWATFTEHIPHVVSRVFIDDAYLWVHINHVNDLVRALQMTEQWGVVVGQKLNHSKSVLWATSGNARQIAKQNFPSLPLFLEFDVLGAKMYTSEREHFLFDQQKLYKVVADIRNIANLPIPRQTKEFLVGCKVLPQISFASQVSKIPKRALDKIQSEIAQVFWGSRPHWRSKMLVFALLTKAFRVEPTCARACSTISEFWRFIHAHPERVQQCCDMLRNHTLGKHSLLARVQDALALFRLHLSEDCCLVFASTHIPVLEVGVRDIKPLLCTLCTQWCYERAADQSRKDLSKPSGFLDIALFKSFSQLYIKPFDKALDLTAHFESQTVGCSITRDRRAAAGYCDSNLHCMNWDLTSSCLA